MIPRLEPRAQLDPAYRLFLSAIERRGFRGEIGIDVASRTAMATDNSVYEMLPQAVVTPANKEDVRLLLEIAAEREHAAITFAPRGGGTGTNGQSLGRGICVDFSRHFRDIRDIDVDEHGSGTVRVGPGVVLDRLNDALAPTGGFFAPMVSTSDRATIGGMIATDAAGKGSCKYGRTSDHVVELGLALTGGVEWTSRSLSPDQLAAAAAQPGIIGTIHDTVDREIREHADEISRRFPPLVRFMTGYNLARIRESAGGAFDLNRLIAGAEGTLAFVTEAVVRVVPRPRETVVVALTFRTFDDALGAASFIESFGPTAVETVDGLILEIACSDVSDRALRPLFEIDGRPAGGLHLVEFAGDDAGAVRAAAERMATAVAAEQGRPDRPVAATVAVDRGMQQALWAMRKRSVGLLGAVAGPRRPVPFVEDCAVPPARLRDFIRGFRAALDEAGLSYGMFGHVDAGCLHVRPALDLCDPADEARLRPITDRVAELAREHGGVLWGEHGKGFRGEYNPMFFGETLYGVMRRIKEAFDPSGRLNPGKMAMPASSTEALLTIEQTTRGDVERRMTEATRAAFPDAVRCNGNAACLGTDDDHVMCPTSRATRDRVHSPKGRAMVMRAWLAHLADAGYDLEVDNPPAGGLLARLGATMGRWMGRPDFSHEVRDAMDGCMACKACAGQCPIKVDVADLRSSFLHAYHGRYLRPLRDHAVAALESALPKAPPLPGPMAKAAARLIGLIDVPQPVRPSLAARMKARGDSFVEATSVGSDDVVIVPDAFTTFFEPDVALAALDTLAATGVRAHIASYQPSGKALHVKGYRDRFARVARREARRLTEFVERGATLVGVEPAVALAFRDEYRDLLGEEAPPVMLLQDWLRAHPPSVDGGGDRVRVLAHCTERALEPESTSAWGDVLQAAGFEATVIRAGCCGMAGVWGHERPNVALSRAIFDSSWARHLEGDGEAVATGYSCRSQVKRYTSQRLRHPVELLAAKRRPAAD